MWAGVAGGLAEYFDLDPALVRLLWVAATILSGGLAVPLYILAWVILPPDDRRPAESRHAWREWSHEVQADAHRVAEEARRVAEELRHTGPHADSGAAPTGQTSETAEWWQSDAYVDRHADHHRHPRSAGILLVGLGILLLAANAGLFSFINWRTMWPLIFIGLGVLLLARQSGWNR